jgi:uracil-DNA glycosylase
MVLQELWEYLEQELFLEESRRDLFNQYRAVDENVDQSKAPFIRQKNLKNYFYSFSEIPSFLLVGEAAGPWGCRFSGVPFTGEGQLCQKLLPFPGERSSRDDPKYSLKKLPPFISSSAKLFWNILKPYHPKFFVWDLVPFHPHKKGVPLGVRTPRADEITKYSPSLSKVIEIINPVKTLASFHPETLIF